VLGSLFALSSLFFLYIGYTQVADGIRSNYWPTVPGRVLSSEVDVSRTGSSSAGSSIGSNSYTPTVRYSYEVEGQPYEAEKLQFIQDGMGQQWAKQKVARYPINTPVEVSYHPNDPQTAVLESGGQLIWYLFSCAAAMAFISLFAVLALFLFKDVMKMRNLGKVTA